MERRASSSEEMTEEKGMRLCVVEGGANPTKLVSASVEAQRFLLADETGTLWLGGASIAEKATLAELNGVTQLQPTLSLAGASPQRVRERWLAAELVPGRSLLVLLRGDGRELLVAEPATTTGYAMGTPISLVARQHEPMTVMSEVTEAGAVATGDVVGAISLHFLDGGSSTSTGHNGPVTVLRMVKKQDLVVSGGADGRALVWNASLEIVREFGIGLGCRPLTLETISLAGRALLLVGSEEGTLALWNSSEPSLRCVFDDTTAPIVAAAWREDTGTIIAADGLGVMRAYKFENDAATLVGECDLGSQPLSVTVDDNALVVWTSDGHVRRWPHEEEEAGLEAEEEEEEELVEELVEEEEEEEEAPTAVVATECLQTMEEDLLPRAIVPMPESAPVRRPTEQSTRFVVAEEFEPAPLRTRQNAASELATATKPRTTEVAEAQALAEAHAAAYARHNAACLSNGRLAAEAQRKLDDLQMTQPRELTSVDQPLQPKKRLVKKQVHARWLERLDALRPRAEAFAIPEDQNELFNDLRLVPDHDVDAPFHNDLSCCPRLVDLLKPISSDDLLL